MVGGRRGSKGTVRIHCRAKKLWLFFRGGGIWGRGKVAERCEANVFRVHTLCPPPFRSSLHPEFPLIPRPSAGFPWPTPSLLLVFVWPSPRLSLAQSQPPYGPVPASLWPSPSLPLAKSQPPIGRVPDPIWPSPIPILPKDTGIQSQPPPGPSPLPSVPASHYRCPSLPMAPSQVVHLAAKPW